MRGRHGRHAAWLLLGCLLLPARARASYEEFSTFDVGHTEDDDEYLLDNEMVRSPLEWHSEFDRALNAFRSSQGCFTAGHWQIDNELKVEAPLGDTARFVLDYRDFEGMEAIYGWTRLQFRFPIANTGLWGVSFSPSVDKSRHDLGALWDHGNAYSPLQVQAAFTIEDIFNNFWSTRQVEVGGEAQPYLRHPYEPALGVNWRGSGTTLSVRGKWLTPSTKRFETMDPALRRTETLWGAKGDGVLSQRIGRTTIEGAFEDIQASKYAYWDQEPGDHHLFNRRWRIKGSLVRDFGEHAHAAVRYFYMDRTEVWRPPIANSMLNVIDRAALVESWFHGPWELGIHVGAWRDRVTVTGDVWELAKSEGTRYEDRAFFSLQKLFGRVRLQGIEGIELDKEPYQVTFHHDKGFLQLQTTF